MYITKHSKLMPFVSVHRKFSLTYKSSGIGPGLHDHHYSIMKRYLKASKWPIFNKIMGCYTIYFIIAVSLTSVNLDLLTELEHFDNIIDDMNDTAVPPVQVKDEILFAEFSSSITNRIKSSYLKVVTIIPRKLILNGSKI